MMMPHLEADTSFEASFFFLHLRKTKKIKTQHQREKQQTKKIGGGGLVYAISFLLGAAPQRKKKTNTWPEGGKHIWMGKKPEPVMLASDPHLAWHETAMHRSIRLFFFFGFENQRAPPQNF